MKRKTLFLLGILIFLLSTIFVIENRTLLFNEVNRKGGSLIELSVAKEINHQKLIDIIEEEVGIIGKNIRIEKNDAGLILRFNRVEKDVLYAISETINNEFGDVIAVSGLATIGEMTYYSPIYLIYIGIFASYLASIIMMVRSYQSKKVGTND